MKFGPDFEYGNKEAYVGYLPDQNALLTGFSVLHESGVGGAAKYGVVSQMPAVGTPDPFTNISAKRARPDEGSVGYFKTSLENGIVVELAGGAHSAFYEYTFPAGRSNSIVVDISHVLPSFRGFG